MILNLYVHKFNDLERDYALQETKYEQLAAFMATM